MKKLLPVLLMVGVNFVFAQNLIPDPSFENTNGTFCGIPSSGDFNATSANWNSPGSGSPDLFFTNNTSTCFNHVPNSNYTGPIGIKGVESPNSGNVMAGIFLYTIPSLNQREYIQTKLSAPLESGKNYEFTINISLADSTEKLVNKLGILFSSSVVTQSGDGVITQTPQIVLNPSNVSMNGWTTLSGTFTANQAFEYITLGNFSDDNNTSTLSNSSYSSKPGTYGSYYYLDDLSLKEVPKDSTDTPDTLITTVLELPNVFSPNGDGINDTFKPINISGITHLKATVYNRWGRVLFKSNDVNFSWNGVTPSGRLASSGTYFYTLEVTDANAKKSTRNGFVSIVR